MPYNPQSAIYHLSATWSPILLVALALGVFLGIWGKRWKYRANVASDQTPRHRKAHAIFHWMNALGFILCIIATVVIFKWFKGPGELTTYTLHFIGSVFILISIGAVAIRAMIYEPRKHKIRITGEDMKELRYELLSYSGLAGKRGFFGFGKRVSVKNSTPPEGAKPQKYLATERILSYPVWVIIAGIMAITGILKALRYTTGMPDSVLYITTKVHDAAAIVAIIMIFVHAGAVIVIKSNWPLLKSMFTLTAPKDFGKDD